MKTQVKLDFFTIIEVALAVAILAVGAVILVSVYPVGVKNSTESMTKTYSSEAAESMFAYISRASLTNTKWNQEGSIYEISSSKPSSVFSNTTEWPVSSDNGIYQVSNDDGSNKYPGVYGIMFKTSDNVDIVGEALVWKTTPSKVFFNKTAMDAEKYNNALIAMNIEISLPLAKPYSQRDKYKYYFEIFNFDPVNNLSQEKKDEKDVDDLGNPQPFEEDNGEVITTKKTKITLEVVGTFFAYSDNTKAPVYAKAKLVSPDKTQSTISPFGTGRLYGGETWETTVESGTKITLQGWGTGLYSYDKNQKYGPFWSTDANQVDALLKGEIPPPYTPAGSQPPYTDLIKTYLNDDNTVNINSNQLLYLFELNSVPKSNKAYDMQDLIILATIEEVETIPEEVPQVTSGVISGSININPSQSGNNEFILTKIDNSNIDLDYFSTDNAGKKTYYASQIVIRPKGNSNENTVKIDGNDYQMDNSSVYKITSENSSGLKCNIWNSQKSGKDKGKGLWWISINGAGSVEKM